MDPRGYVGVVGPGAASPEQVEQAAEVGRLLAQQGMVVVTGGLAGVMQAASRGATEAGGMTLGLLPGADRSAANPYLTLSVPTGLGEMRNALLVRTCDAVVAVGTSWGTLSEVALAARTGVPAVMLGGMRFLDEVPAGGGGTRQPVAAESPSHAVATVVRLVGQEDRADAWVLGVDRDKGSWVGVLLPIAGSGESRLVRAPDLATLVDRAAQVVGVQVAIVAVDIPIGLPDTGVRQADVLARGRVGPRASSIFTTPVRDALAADTYAEARRISVERTGGRSVAAQSYALRAAILDVDAYVRGGGEGRVVEGDGGERRAGEGHGGEGQNGARAGKGHRGVPRVVEVHPEVSFAALAGAALHTRKSTPEGVRERVDLLTAAGIGLPADLDLTRRDAHDILDAAAAAWTGARVLAGRAERLPAEPERFSDGIDAAIWV